jgi:small conductance mechanosensitive channel
MNADSLINWATTNLLALLVGLVVLILVYRYAKPLMKRAVLAVLKAQQATLDAGGENAEEVRKRAATLEDLLARLIRFAAITIFVVLVLSAFDLWPMLAGLGLIAAALTIAGQAIILDFLMGVLILAEGQYFKGDWISVDGPNQVLEGEVEEVGLRRTVLRNSQGVVHSISNGIIRSPSNMTRIYAMATVDMPVLHATDLDRTIEIVNRVGKELADDPAWKSRIIETPQYLYVSTLTIDGASVRVRGRVEPGQQWNVASELRRRLVKALTDEKIDIGRWDVPAAANLNNPQAAQS